MSNQINTFAAMENDMVAGLYCGLRFAGRISDLRPHTMNWKKMVLFVELDTSIIVFGDERKNIVLEVSAKGYENNNTYITNLAS